MKDILDIIVLILFVFMVFMFVRGFNKQQINKYKNKLENKKLDDEKDKSNE